MCLPISALISASLQHQCGHRPSPPQSRRAARHGYGLRCPGPTINRRCAAAVVAPRPDCAARPDTPETPSSPTRPGLRNWCCHPSDFGSHRLRVHRRPAHRRASHPSHHRHCLSRPNRPSGCPVTRPIRRADFEMTHHRRSVATPCPDWPAVIVRANRWCS